VAGAVDEIVEVLGIDAASRPESLDPDLDALANRFGIDGGGPRPLERLIEMRDRARAEGRFDEADEIRAALDDAGVTLEDGPDGTRWLRK
jgi:cysteinyl-tRNA synthetase